MSRNRDDLIATFRQRARGWFASRSYVRYRLGFWMPYWRVKRFFAKRQHTLLSWSFNTRYRVGQRKQDASSITALVRQVISTIPLTICALVGLELLRPVLAYAALFLPDTISRSVIPRLSSPADANAYTSLFATLAGVSGVFLGLYFTAISALASGIYAKAPRDVRTLLVSDKLSEVYTKVVAHLGVASCLLLAGQVLGWSCGGLVVVAMTLLGALSLFCFVALGLRTFNFYDPTILAQQTLATIQQQLNLSTPKGARFRNPSFQSTYHRIANNSLETLANIVRLSTRNDAEHINADALLTIANLMLSLFQYSSKQKKLVPSDSHWFETELENPNWLTHDSSNVSIALRTSTMLRPKSIKNHDWLEERFAPLISAIVKTLLDRKSYDVAERLIVTVSHYQYNLAHALSVEEAKLLQHSIDAVAEPLIKAFGTHTKPPGQSLATADKMGLALVDYRVSGPMNMMLGLAKYLSEFRGEAFSKSLGTNPEKLRKSASLVVARKVKDEVEKLADAIEFEKQCEGKVITQPWYVAQLVALELLREIVRSTTTLIKVLQDSSTTFLKSLPPDCHAFVRAHLTLRGLEACAKAHLMVDSTHDFFGEANKLRLMSDVPWVEDNSAALAKDVKKCRGNLLIHLSVQSAPLALLPPIASLPDYFGQIFSVLTDEAFQVLQDGDIKTFKPLFIAAVPLGLASYERLLASLESQELSTRLIYASEPLIDLFDLSGYAIIYSELREGPFWEVARAEWEQLCGKSTDGKRAKALAAIAHYRSTPFFGLTPRALMRTEWEQRMMADFRERNLVRANYGSFVRRPYKPIHKSPVVEYMARHDFLMTKPHDVFYAMYLSELPSIADAEWPRSMHEFKRFLEKRKSSSPDDPDISGPDDE